MVRAAAELLAIEPTDARARGRDRETARRLDDALHSRSVDPRAILDASPLVPGHEGDPEAGVRSAMTRFQVSDWTPAN